MQKDEIFLKDYLKPNFNVSSLFLEFEIADDFTIVTSIGEYEKNNSNSKELELDGTNQELLEITLDGNVLSNTDYVLNDSKLKIFNVPNKFSLKIKTKVDPFNNFSGDGLYKSGNILCTQCEAEGFRRITYFMDRPDVMTKYKTKIIADKGKYPFLLSNGNKIESGVLGGGKHYTVWEDPFKKPCYLFALVAGDLKLQTGVYETSSARKVSLEVYVDPGNEDKCAHAIESLKKSMKWDEDTFGLEYDLDVYMIVAVDSFNMGAMENKGLNIFNSAYVLAKEETATDEDYMGIEAVIGHEYFHNWTGNRVTCRDWFQLTLKEGLTVFRDQEFSSDMLSRSVKRIEDVVGLKGLQFAEDAGPLSHPIKPKSFVEINNFYTSTIYEKGAEIIRMIHTIIGKDNFRKGMDLYFQKFDGMAITTEDFLSAMAQASGVELSHFSVWYDQNGTPKVKVQTEYNEKTKSLNITFKQNSILNNDNFDCLYIPLHFSLYNPCGELVFKNHDYVLNSPTYTLTIDGVPNNCVLSVNENFTAPIIIEQDLTVEDKILLMGNAEDEYSRFNAAQDVLVSEIETITKQILNGQMPCINPLVKESYLGLLESKTDLSFKALALKIPTLKDINDKRDTYEFVATKKAIDLLRKEISSFCESKMMELLDFDSLGRKYEYNSNSIGIRSFNFYLIESLSVLNKKEFLEMAKNAFKDSTNMSVEFSLLQTLTSMDVNTGVEISNLFYNKWKHETLVIQKWLKVQAASIHTNIEEMKKMEELEVYDNKVPNLVRALLGGYMRFNFSNFHKENGEGYEYIANKVIEIDKFNPQIAAGMCRGLNFKNKLDSKRKGHLVSALTLIVSEVGISSDVKEVVSKNLV